MLIIGDLCQGCRGEAKGVYGNSPYFPLNYSVNWDSSEEKKIKPIFKYCHSEVIVLTYLCAVAFARNEQIQMTRVACLSCSVSFKFITTKIFLIKEKWGRGFPGGTVVENLPANVGDMGLSPGLGRSHMQRSN